MQVLTIKAKPKTIFGVALALTGVIVILLTFAGNHGVSATAAAPISCASEADRAAYLTSLGWEFDDAVQQKQVTIPTEFNEVYQRYSALLAKEGFRLEDYKGKQAEIYTYQIKNYDGNDRIIADLIVADGVLIGADLCDPAADSGFLVAMTKRK